MAVLWLRPVFPRHLMPARASVVSARPWSRCVLLNGFSALFFTFALRNVAGQPGDAAYASLLVPVDEGPRLNRAFLTVRSPDPELDLALSLFRPCRPQL